jgi:TatD DNase family protein
MSAESKTFLVDSHCHLDFPELAGNLEEVIKVAALNNVRYLQTISTKIKEFPIIRQIAEAYEPIFCSVGNHPLNLDSEGIITSRKIVKLCSHKKVTAIGETGLDYYYSKENFKVQQESFIEHIKAAQETGLPIIVHTREAEEDTIELLTAMYKKKHFTGVIHCFTASEQLARACLEIGLYISASGIVTFKNAKSIANSFVNVVPIERILIETDSPYLAPDPMRGKPNQPAYVVHTAKFMAKLKEIDYSEFCKKTTENYFELFKKASQYIGNKAG